MTLTDILPALAQLRAVLRETHTAGDDTLRMAGCLNLVDKIVQAVQDEINQDDADN